MRYTFFKRSIINVNTIFKNEVSDLSRPELTVIEGGLSVPVSKREKYFVSAYVTDTRLMGVLSIYARWRLSGSSDTEADLHQFFYIDCEEMGLETYKSIIGNDSNELSYIEQALMGGLGAKKNRSCRTSSSRPADLLQKIQ